MHRHSLLFSLCFILGIVALPAHASPNYPPTEVILIDEVHYLEALEERNKYHTETEKAQDEPEIQQQKDKIQRLIIKIIQNPETLARTKKKLDLFYFETLKKYLSQSPYASDFNTPQSPLQRATLPAALARLSKISEQNNILGHSDTSLFRINPRYTARQKLPLRKQPYRFARNPLRVQNMLGDKDASSLR